METSDALPYSAIYNTILLLTYRSMIVRMVMVTLDGDVDMLESGEERQRSKGEK
jgi:hypothetical protein